MSSYDSSGLNLHILFYGRPFAMVIIDVVTKRHYKLTLLLQVILYTLCPLIYTTIQTQYGIILIGILTRHNIHPSIDRPH